MASFWIYIRRLLVYLYRFPDKLKLPDDKALILMFHHITDEKVEASPSCLCSVNNFLKILEYLKRNNIKVVSIDEALSNIRKKIFSEVGFFDDNIFMYGEEVDLFIRIKQAGYRNIFVSDAIVRHLKGKSSDGKDSGILEEFTSLIYLYKKYSNFLNVLLLRILLISGALLRIFVFGIIRRYPKRINLYVKAIEAVRR